MKITIVNGEHLGSKVEMEIDTSDTINNIRDKIGKYLDRKENNFLIYKNIILQNEKSTVFYKICPNDEIWCGKIEKYLKCNDVILDIFLVSCGHYGLLINLIVNTDDAIGGIRLILEAILTGDVKIIDIWNDQGESMGNNQFIRQIHTSKGERRIICRLDDGDMDRSFDECCDIYDQYLVDRLWVDGYLFDFTFYNDMHKYEDSYLIPIVKDIALWFVDSTEDARFDEDLASMARCLQHSSYLCCTSIAGYIYDNWVNDILHGDWGINWIWEKYPQYGYNGDLVRHMFDRYFQVAILAAVVEYATGLSSLHDNHQRHHHKSIRDIMRDAVERLGTYLAGTSTIMQHFMISANKLFMKCRDEDWMRHVIDDRHWITLDVQMSLPKESKVYIARNTKTILQFKKVISLQAGTPLQQIFLIDNARHLEPKDEDLVDEETSYSCQFVQNMDDIEKGKLIGQGSFGEIFLFRYKMSDKQFALKRPLANSLDREIIIHATIGEYSSNICRYRGLFNYKGRICSAMDYKSGGTLDGFIRKRKYLQVHELAKISHQILIQIKKMHNRGVIH